MNPEPFSKVIKNICLRDNRYKFDAYFFVRDALDFTTKSLGKTHAAGSVPKHVSGKELLEGIRQFVLQEYGPMSLTVLDSWGIRKTDDFGEIVFNLVNSGKLGCTDEDKKEDFANGYNFEKVFQEPFMPQDNKQKEIAG